MKSKLEKLSNNKREPVCQCSFEDVADHLLSNAATHCKELFPGDQALVLPARYASKRYLE